MIRKVIKDKLSMLVGEPYTLLFLFFAFLIGVFYAGGDAFQAAVDLGVWLGLLYLGMALLYKLL